MTEVNWSQFYALDLPALLASLFAALSCALLGSFLVLRRQSLMGDAISHAVLPGIVVAFLISGANAQFSVFIGAAIAGILSSALIEAVIKFGRLESGAAMGVVFSVFFAAGVLLIEQASAGNIHLDADCLLHGQLETIFWNPPQVSNWGSFVELLRQVPGEVYASLGIALLTVFIISFFYKELAISSFDPSLATALGFDARLIHYLLMVMVAAAVVASFKVVGSILVIAMIICPPATARLLTDKLKTQLILSAFFAVLSVTSGYFIAAFGPFWIGFANSVSAAGMMAVSSGIFLSLTVFFAPQYGLVARKLRRYRLTRQVAREDLLGLLYRAEELSSRVDGILTTAQALEALESRRTTALAISDAERNGEIQSQKNMLRLTERGRESARNLVRTHRLWETFLVKSLGLSPDHVHHTATQLEHYTTEELARLLDEKQNYPEQDPHGKSIPKSKPK